MSLDVDEPSSSQAEQYFDSQTSVETVVSVDKSVASLPLLTNPPLMNNDESAHERSSRRIDGGPREPMDADVKERSNTPPSSTPRYVSNVNNTSAGASTSSAVEAVLGESDENNSTCGLCRLLIAERSIQCDGCKSNFHSDTLCLGIEKDEISVLLNNTNGALLYKCCLCRSGKSGATGAITQLLRMVGALVRECFGG